MINEYHTYWERGQGRHQEGKKGGHLILARVGITLYLDKQPDGYTSYMAHRIRKWSLDMQKRKVISCCQLTIKDGDDPHDTNNDRWREISSKNGTLTLSHHRTLNTKCDSIDHDAPNSYVSLSDLQCSGIVYFSSDNYRPVRGTARDWPRYKLSLPSGAGRQTSTRPPKNQDHEHYPPRNHRHQQDPETNKRPVHRSNINIARSIQQQDQDTFAKEEHWDRPRRTRNPRTAESEQTNMARCHSIRQPACCQARSASKQKLSRSETIPSECPSGHMKPKI